MIIDSLKKIVDQNREVDPLYLRNLLKENLQYYVLNFVYGSKWGENLLFKGGSCLRMFFDLPRLSEDLDLDFINKDSFVLANFLLDLEKYFSRTLQYKNLQTKLSGKENIIYLKFPLLDKLGLAESGEKTKILFLRVDLAWAVGKKYKTEISLKSTYDFSFLVRRYSLEDLFAGKIAAILQRTSKEKGGVKPRTKGRDYFDLAWFLEKKITPNFGYLQEIVSIDTQADLKLKLKKKIEALDLKILQDDLMPLFKDKVFVRNFVKNYKRLTYTWQELTP